MEKIQFKVRRKGGKSAGKTITAIVPKFDWEAFKKLPNAEQFVRRAYQASVRELARKEDEKKLSAIDADPLSTLESVILSAIACRKVDIDEWFAARDWAAVGTSDEMVKSLRKWMDNPPRDKLDVIREHIAGAADSPSDWVADYLFTKLDPANSPPEITADML